MSAVMGPRGGGPRSGVTPPNTRADPEIIPLGTPMDKAIDNDDRIWAQERHARRMKLMRMQGDVNRQETRLHILWAVTILLAIVAVALAAFS